MIPKDPMILLSYVNTQLRDFYPSLEALAEGLEVDQEDLVKKLAGIDYEYDAQRNQFVYLLDHLYPFWIIEAIRA